MDRSFLSRPEVIAASRQFVCVRLATYEDAEEGEMLKNFTPTRSGELENSVFGILSPNGREKLIRSGRSIRQVYSSSQQMAEGMKRISSKYETKDSPRALPLVANVRLALDVAAADNQPLVVISAKDDESRKTLETQITNLAWEPEFIGHFVYVSANDAMELQQISGVKTFSGLLVVQPNKFGTEGQILGQATQEASAEQLAQTLRSALSLFAGQQKSFQNHVREGHQQGVFWETEIPVTDPQEQGAGERGRREPSKK